MTEIILKQPYKGKHPWTLEGPNVLDSANLEIIKETFEKHGSIIIEHWHFYGSRAPDRLILDDYEEFIEYLTENAIAGDIIDTWAMHEICNKDNMLVFGKCPNSEGLTPENGAY